MKAQLSREIVDTVLELQKDALFDDEIGAPEIVAFSTAVRSSSEFGAFLDNQVALIQNGVLPIRARLMGTVICAMYAGWQAREYAYANRQLEEMFKER